MKLPSYLVLMATAALAARIHVANRRDVAGQLDVNSQFGSLEAIEGCKTATKIQICKEAGIQGCTKLNVCKTPLDEDDLVCVDFPNAFNDQVSSVDVGDPVKTLKCRFYTDKQCTGKRWETTGAVKDTIPAEFNDKFSSVACMDKKSKKQQVVADDD